MNNDILHQKYRPQTFEDVVGQDAVVKSLTSVLSHKGSQAFMLYGPSGVGKTTLARIACHKLGCHDDAIMEIDAATNTGIDEMRAIQADVQYRPFGGDARAVIIDECHRLSRNAWDSMLKVLEEPPKYLTWWLCTTEASKVPHTIKTRCATFTLKSVTNEDLHRLLKRVCKAEGIKTDYNNLIVYEAHGSPRQLLVNLVQCRNATSEKEAKEVLRSAQDSEPVRELCQLLLKGENWQKAMAIVGRMEHEAPESVRILVSIYLSKVLQGATNEDRIIHLLNMLEAFSTPYNASDQTAPLLRSIGKCLF